MRRRAGFLEEQGRHDGQFAQYVMLKLDIGFHCRLSFRFI